MRLFLAGLPAVLIATAAPAATPAQFAQLLAADRAAAADAKGKDVVTALGALFDEDVVLVA